MLVPFIVQPTRIRNSSKTLTDNIYSDVITPNNTSANLTVTTSGHLPQFLLFLFSNTRSTKLNIFERERPKFNQENFIFDYLSLDWENLIKSDNGNVDQSFVNFFTNSDYI